MNKAQIIESLEKAPLPRARLIKREKITSPPSVKRRNVAFHIPDDLKEDLKNLAAASHLPMETYLRAVVEDAVVNKYQYRPTRVPAKV